MTERRLYNTIYLMYLVTDIYCRAHGMTPKEFLELNEKRDIINFVAECPDYYDSMTDEEILEDLDEYFAGV